MEQLKRAIRCAKSARIDANCAQTEREKREAGEAARDAKKATLAAMNAYLRGDKEAEKKAADEAEAAAQRANDTCEAEWLEWVTEMLD